MGKQDQVQDFLRFKFEEDPRWATFLKGFEVVNNDAGAMGKLKAKFYKRNIDVNFDPTWLTDAQSRQAGAGQTSSSARGASGASAGSAPPPHQPSSRSYTPPPQSSGRGGGGGASTRSAPELLFFLYHIILLALAVLHLIPLFPRLGLYSYRLFLQLAAGGQFYKVYSKYGAPQFSLSGIQAYIRTVAATSDCHFALVSLAFAPQRPLALILLPLTIRAVYAVDAYLAANYAHNALWATYGRRAHDWLLAKERAAKMTSVYSELSVGAILVVSLLSANRNIFLTFMYWNLLKMRYLASDEAVQHQSAWAVIDQTISPFLARFPIAAQIVGYAKRWFLQQ